MVVGTMLKVSVVVMVVSVVVIVVVAGTSVLEDTVDITWVVVTTELLIKSTSKMPLE